MSSPSSGLSRPERDRVGAAIGVHGGHLVDGGERVCRIVAQLEDPYALPAGRVAVRDARSAAHGRGHRAVDSHEEQVGDAVPVPVPDDGIVLVGVALDVLHERGRRRVRDVEDAHTAAGRGTGRAAAIAGVVADEGMVTPEREI